MEKLTVRELEIAKLTFDFNSTDIKGYAMAWLKLTNLAREYGKLFLKIKNDRSSNVYVYCLLENVERIKNGCTEIYTYQNTSGEWESVGKLLGQESITVGIPVYDGVNIEEWLPVMWDVDFEYIAEQ